MKKEYSAPALIVFGTLTELTNYRTRYRRWLWRRRPIKRFKRGFRCLSGGKVSA